MLPATIQDYVENLENPNQRKYIIDLFTQIQQEGKKVAYHGACPDGAVSAALLKFLGWGDLFVPLDYNILKDEKIRQFLIETEWEIIIDLEPFNKKQLELYVDHHRSVIGSTINSRRIYFDVGEYGPSAAYVLHNHVQSFTNIPDYISYIVKMTKTTDTATFKIDPPLEKISTPFSSLLDDFDHSCWFLVDACSIEDEFSLMSNNELVDNLASHGIKGLLKPHIISRVNEQRDLRLEAKEFMSQIDVKDLVIVVNAPNKTFKQYLALKLGKVGAKIIIFLTERDRIVSISLRQSKLNTKQEVKKFSLDVLAKLIDPTGGGHREAAGSSCKTLNQAITIIETWSKEKELTKNIIYYKKNR